MVTDPSGAVVPKAGITIRNQETGAERQAETNASGEYSVPLLPPAFYRITVEAPGFRRAIRRDIKLDVAGTVRVDVGLELGDLSGQVEVAGTVPLIQADTSSLGQLLDQQKFQELPLNERSFMNFALLVPGAQTHTDGSQVSSQGLTISVNGAREQANNFLLDGVDNNILGYNLYTVLPSVDAIQEFKVQSSNSSAEFGRSGGAQINVVLKSGSNRLHGGLFEFFRNRRLDAKNFFDRPDCTSASVPGTCAEIPRFDRQQFGSNLGGPVRRDKTFFFAAYESLRLRQATTRRATVPSQLERAATLAAVPPALRNPAGAAVLQLLPAANVGLDLSASNLFVADPVIRVTLHQFALKMDHRVGRNDTLSGHYALSHEDRFNPYSPLDAFTNLPGYGSFTSNPAQNARLNWLHVFNPRRINELRIGFNRLGGGIRHESSGINRSEELGFPVVSSNRANWGFPMVRIAGFDGIGETFILPQNHASNTLHLADNLAWKPALHGGRHQLKFGADLRPYGDNGTITYFARGQWFFFGVFSEGDPLRDLIRGLPTLAIAGTGEEQRNYSTTAVNLYAQDDIRISARFTLNLGLRYEYNSPPVDSRDRVSIPDLSPNSLTCTPKPECQFLTPRDRGISRGIYRRDLNNFAPRLGFAWRPRGERFVVRGAYGVFYDAGIVNLTSLSTINPPFYSIAQFPNMGGKTIQNILAQPVTLPGIVAKVDPDYHDAYMQHWNLNLQYEAMRDLVVDLAYVGSKGAGLLARRNANQGRPPGESVPFPQFGPIMLAGSLASSSYNALQFRSEKRFGGGLGFLAAYTWSKSLDDASQLFDTAVELGLPQDSFNSRADRALSNFHTSHRFVLSAQFSLPLGPGRRWLHRPGLLSHLLGNWSLGTIWTLQTGRPFTVNRDVDQSGTTTPLGNLDRPDQIANPFRPGPVPHHPDPACHNTRAQGGRAAASIRTPETWFNPCAFAAPATRRFGTAGRNSVIGPGLKNIDLSVVKEIPLFREGHRLQFRVEFFNLPNHPNFDVPNRTFDSPNFSALQSANAYSNKPPRQIQLGLKYIF